MVKKLFVVVTILFILFSFSFDSASAAISACSVTVDPTTLSGGASASLVFNITNNDQDSNLLYWVKIIAPTSDFSLTSGDGPSLGGVTISDDHSSVIINTTLSGGETGAFTIGVTAGNNEVSSSAFTVLTSANSAGDEPTTCTGDSSVSISGNTQAILSISDIKVSTNDTVATLSWTTGGNTTGLVDYGTSTEYGSQATHTTLGTSHSISLTGLSASTTYHFRITSTDANQNSVQSSDNNFVTGSAGATVETTITTTTVNTVVQIKEVKDTTPPSVSITSKLQAVYAYAPEIEGKAQDDGGISEVLYSVDDGKNWLHVNSGTIGAKKVTFSFSPEIHDDGNYMLLVKAIDPTGNEKVTLPVTLVIDRLPPLIGGVVLSIGPQILTPQANGAIVFISGLSPKLTFSAVGGPTNITVSAGSHVFTANKNTDNGLWSAEIDISEPGTYTLQAHETDGANNKTDQDLSTIVVLPRATVTSNGAPITDAVLSVYFYDPQTLSFLLWNAKEYGAENPQVVDKGTYTLLLPAGTYYIKITSPVTQTIVTKIFTVTASQPITTNFTLSQKRHIQIGSLVLSLPEFLQTNESVTVDLNVVKEEKINSLVGKAFPYFKFGDVDANSLLGKPTLITLLSSWHPQAVEELTVLDSIIKKNVHALSILTQESSSSVEVFFKRAGFTVPIVADPDGALVASLKFTNIPTHYFTDRKGIIRVVKTGLLGADEIQTIMGSL